MFFFFFFQAEDGIRDGTVTGVQTCALPIFERLPDGAAELPGYGGSAQAADQLARRLRCVRGSHSPASGELRAAAAADRCALQRAGLADAPAGRAACSSAEAPSGSADGAAACAAGNQR